MDDAQHQARYQDLLGRHMAALRRLAWSYARDEFEDLFQEIATALWTALPGFRGDSSERTWVYRVAHNTAISFAVQRKRRAGREATGESAPDPASDANPERDAIGQQQRARCGPLCKRCPSETGRSSCCTWKGSPQGTLKS